MSVVAENTLSARRFGIDTYLEPVVYIRADSPVCRSEGFAAQTRVRVGTNGAYVTATLNVVTSDLLQRGEIGLSDAAWNHLAVAEGTPLRVTHAEPLQSMSHVRAKVYGRKLEAAQLAAIVNDIVAGRYSDVETACFITAAADDRLDVDEMIALTRAMVESGDRLTWPTHPVVDKHCVGGLPGNRTTLIVVPIVAACGFTIPKTSSRAITSPAGTADTMETLAPVILDLPAMRRVVEREGGCIVWGGGVRLSPADDVFIRVERALELDSTGQLVASILSKKAAAGATHALIDVPVGPTAKIRSAHEVDDLQHYLAFVGRSLGLTVDVVVSDGTQPVGRGVGPALEALDVLAVLRNDEGAPADLRDRSVLLAGRLLELSGQYPPGHGLRKAADVLHSGAAERKFLAICEAQGGLREPALAPHHHDVCAPRAGRVAGVDNRRLAKIAKLAGAPHDPAAGLRFLAPVGARVERGQPLFTIYAESPGELAYALDFTNANPLPVQIEEGP
jgi:thymidine phosphorylase